MLGRNVTHFSKRLPVGCVPGFGNRGLNNCQADKDGKNQEFHSVTPKLGILSCISLGALSYMHYARCNISNWLSWRAGGVLSASLN